MGPLFQGLLGAGTSIGGQWLANSANKKLAEDQRNWNLEQWNRQNAYDTMLWNRQNQYNLDMWRMQNEYNSPVEQMARFKAAGLNPHLIYGKGTPGNANDVGQASQNAASVQGYNRTNVDNIMRGIDVFGQAAQLKNLNAQTNNTEAQTDLAHSELVLKQMQQSINLLKYDSDRLDYNTKKATQQFLIKASALQNAKLEQDMLKTAQDIESMKTRQEADKTQIQLNNQSYARRKWLYDQGLNEQTPWYVKGGLDWWQKFTEDYNQFLKNNPDYGSFFRLF